MIAVVRWMDRFYEAHPTIAFLIAICCVFLILEIACDWDRADTDALRLEMMAASVRGST